MSYSEAPWCANDGIAISKKMNVNAVRRIPSLLMEPPVFCRLDPPSSIVKTLAVVNGLSELLVSYQNWHIHIATTP
jgi:hypothetical protein